MINGDKVANQGGLNKPKINKGQKQNVMNNDTEVQVHRQRYSLSIIRLMPQYKVMGEPATPFGVLEPAQ